MFVAVRAVVSVSMVYHHFFVPVTPLALLCLWQLVLVLQNTPDLTIVAPRTTCLTSVKDSIQQMLKWSEVLICHVLTDFELKKPCTFILHTANFHSPKLEKAKNHLKLRKFAIDIKWYWYILQYWLLNKCSRIVIHVNHIYSALLAYSRRDRLIISSNIVFFLKPNTLRQGNLDLIYCSLCR